MHISVNIWTMRSLWILTPTERHLPERSVLTIGASALERPGRRPDHGHFCRRYHVDSNWTEKTKNLSPSPNLVARELNFTVPWRHNSKKSHEICGEIISADSLLLSVVNSIVIHNYIQACTQDVFSIINLVKSWKKFLAPSGAQEILISVRSFICLIKSVLELTIFIFLSQVSLRSRR